MPSTNRVEAKADNVPSTPAKNTEGGRTPAAGRNIDEVEVENVPATPTENNIHKPMTSEEEKGGNVPLTSTKKKGVAAKKAEVAVDTPPKVGDASMLAGASQDGDVQDRQGQDIAALLQKIAALKEQKEMLSGNLDTVIGSLSKIKQQILCESNDVSADKLTEHALNHRLKQSVTWDCKKASYTTEKGKTKKTDHEPSTDKINMLSDNNVMLINYLPKRNRERLSGYHKISVDRLPQYALRNPLHKPKRRNDLKQQFNARVKWDVETASYSGNKKEWMKTAVKLTLTTIKKLKPTFFMVGKTSHEDAETALYNRFRDTYSYWDGGKMLLLADAPDHPGPESETRMLDLEAHLREMFKDKEKWPNFNHGSKNANGSTTRRKDAFHFVYLAYTT